MKYFTIAIILLALALLLALVLERSPFAMAAGITPFVGKDMGCTGAGQVLEYDGTNLVCAPDPATGLQGTTGSIGGGLLTVGSCATGTATVTGASVGMVAVANPVTYQGDGVQYQAYVSSANTVTVKACALLLITPSATIYNVRVIP